jgi:hypothetical protein
VVRDADGELWPVTAAEFASTYEGPLEADDLEVGESSPANSDSLTAQQIT